MNITQEKKLKEKLSIVQWLMISSHFLSGWMNSAPSDGGFGFLSITSNILGLMFFVLMYFWFEAHASLHGVSKGRRYAVFAALIPFIGVPYYYYKLYDIRKGTRKLLIILAFLLICLIAYVVGSYMHPLRFSYILKLAPLYLRIY